MEGIHYTVKDENIRKEISAMLNSYDVYQDTYYREQKTIKILSWPQIFFEIGKLTEKVSNNCE